MSKCTYAQGSRTSIRSPHTNERLNSLSRSQPSRRKSRSPISRQESRTSKSQPERHSTTTHWRSRSNTPLALWPYTKPATVTSHLSQAKSQDKPNPPLQHKSVSAKSQTAPQISPHHSRSYTSRCHSRSQSSRRHSRSQSFRRHSFSKTSWHYSRSQSPCLSLQQLTQSRSSHDKLPLPQPQHDAPSPQLQPDSGSPNSQTSPQKSPHHSRSHTPRHHSRSQTPPLQSQSQTPRRHSRSQTPRDSRSQTPRRPSRPRTPRRHSRSQTSRCQSRSRSRPYSSHHSTPRSHIRDRASHHSRSAGPHHEHPECAVKFLKEFKPKLYRMYKKKGFDLESVIPERYRKYQRLRDDKIYLGCGLSVDLYEDYLKTHKSQPEVNGKSTGSQQEMTESGPEVNRK
ncbi:hypothetical protein TSAR_001665 [Trichomalopsis sarcophagae]|uniref:Uncharacterized protein n=1 Tax=Trichomalopsis sarcophagae TaxID=543379 RepID=A0A232F719_9HYME|nr:hypothetical protein TSAR_001665 [Trichomalopsis sarcophagae]